MDFNKQIYKIYISMYMIISTKLMMKNIKLL